MQENSIDTIREWLGTALATGGVVLAVLYLWLRSRLDGTYATAKALDIECRERKLADEARDKLHVELRDLAQQALGRVEMIERGLLEARMDRRTLHEEIGELREAQQQADGRIRTAELVHERTLGEFRTAMAQMETRIADAVRISTREAIQEVVRLYRGEQSERR
jgi:hypothetical protein